jgi:crossover junction endodeoxyribonuclease RusA
MSLSIEFTAYGTPKGQPRPKATIRGKHAGVYDPGTANDWKDAVRFAAKEAWRAFNPRPKFTGPVCLWIMCHMPRPANHIRANGTLKDWAPKWVESKPDFDNVGKAIADALTSIGIWNDDAQVARCIMEKVYAMPGTASRAEIRIQELTQ